MTLAGPDAQLFMASDHGFTATVDVVRINRYLGELGYLTWAQGDGSEADQRRRDANFAYLDWARTTAYCPTPSSNGICIRVADAPGKPGVAPEDYVAFRERLMADLRALTDPETGEPKIRDILTREQAFPGAAMGEAPDLTLVLHDFGFVSVRDKAPVVQKRPVPIGTHHPDGIFIAAGPGIEHGAGPRMNIVDVPSLLVHSLGLPVPEDFEGHIPEALFTGEWLMYNPPRSGPAATPVGADTGPRTGDDDMPEEEKAHIMDQLRALGYLED